METNILEAIDEASEWLDIDGVEGVAPGEKEDCIEVFSSCAPSELADRIPSSFMGYPVIIKETGIIDAL
jgi:hypothetical protein